MTRAGARREVLATAAIVALFAGLLLGRQAYRRLRPHPSAERCAAMLERHAEQEARAYERAPAGPGSATPASAAEVLRCQRELTEDEVDCALRAGWADELERCLPP